MRPPAYIEMPNGRLYHVVNVAGYPRGPSGRSCRVVVDHDRQMVFQSGFIPSVVAAAVMQDYVGSGEWQIAQAGHGGGIPLVGNVD